MATHPKTKPHIPPHPFIGGEYGCDYTVMGTVCSAQPSDPIHSRSSQDRILIERRELIGEVTLGNGSEPALKVAFEMAAKYISELSEDGDVKVGFDFEDFHFFVGREAR